MKKLLEVLQYGEYDIRFNTDIDVKKTPDMIPSVASKSAVAMMTTLWGGNETSVIAMIRALSIADLAASVNPKEMADFLYDSAMILKRCMAESKQEFEKAGGKMVTFAPGIKPSSNKS